MGKTPCLVVPIPPFARRWLLAEFIRLPYTTRHNCTRLGTSSGRQVRERRLTHKNMGESKLDMYDCTIRSLRGETLVAKQSPHSTQGCIETGPVGQVSATLAAAACLCPISPLPWATLCFQVLRFQVLLAMFIRAPV
jgi:hypothetical protein